MPLVNLSHGTIRVGKTGGIQLTTNRVTDTIRTVGVELSSTIVTRHVDQGLINECNKLQIIRSLEQLYTLKSTFRNQTTTVTLLGAPSDLNTLGVCDVSVRLGGSEDTEI